MNVYELTCRDLTNKEFNLGQLKGSVTMFVNVASECGYTKQYAELQHLHGSYSDNVFSVIAFPCNDCLLYTSPSPRDRQKSRMPSSA